MQVVGDTRIEVAETFSLNLTHPVNATFADPAAQGTITDNDTVSISIGGATITETNSGTRDAVFTVILSTASGSTVTVDYVTADSSATAPADFVAINGTLTFAPRGGLQADRGAGRRRHARRGERVVLGEPLEPGQNATIGGSGYGLGTITNND